MAAKFTAEEAAELVHKGKKLKLLENCEGDWILIETDGFKVSTMDAFVQEIVKTAVREVRTSYY